MRNVDFVCSQITNHIIVCTSNTGSAVSCTVTYDRHNQSMCRSLRDRKRVLISYEMTFSQIFDSWPNPINHCFGTRRSQRLIKSIQSWIVSWMRRRPMSPRHGHISGLWQDNETNFYSFCTNLELKLSTNRFALKSQKRKEIFYCNFWFFVHSFLALFCVELHLSSTSPTT